MLNEECNDCYFHHHSICPVNNTITLVGGVEITSFFIPTGEYLSDKCDRFRANIKRKPCQALIDKVRVWLGDDGRVFFTEIKEKYGQLNACWFEKDSDIPHAVHFREGMAVRNFMRSTGGCLDWDDIDYDDNWVEVVEKALGI